MLQAIKKLTSMAIPMLSTRVVQLLTTFLMMLMLAQLGHKVLAASLLISTFRTVVSLICMSTLFITGAFFGRLYAEKDYDGLSACLIQALIAAILLSIPGILIYWFIGPILALLQQPAEVIPIAETFLHTFAWALPCYLIALVLQQFLSAIKRQVWVTYLSIALLVINVSLAYWLIFGGLGLHGMGVFGGALASVIAGLISVITYSSCLLVIYRKSLKFSWQPLDGLHHLKKILRIGSPICFQLSSEMLSILVIITMVGWLGATAMAATQISNEYIMFVIVPIFGIGEASSIVIGHAVGNKDHDNLRKYGYASVIAAISYTLMIAIVFVFFHRTLADWYIGFDSPNAEAIYHLAMWVMGIRIFNMLFDGTADVLVCALRGVLDTKFPMYLSILSDWCLTIPISAVFAFYLDWGVIGIVVAGLLVRIAGAFILNQRWLYKTHHEQLSRL